MSGQLEINGHKSVEEHRNYEERNILMKDSRSMEGACVDQAWKATDSKTPWPSARFPKSYNSALILD